jgi:putative peptidoglycan lipid II flippase
MIRSILSVGALTLLSRITGFLRDVVMAGVLGAGPLADAFMIAFRLPNHFRAIFAEGAFNSAFVPAYARERAANEQEAGFFAGRILSYLLVANLLLLLFVFVFTGFFVGLLAPGLDGSDGRLPAAIELTRLTFPYLLLITIMTLYGGLLNATGRYAAVAGAPVLLNLTLLATLTFASVFPTAGHAAAWGVTLSGVLQLALVAVAAWRADLLPPLVMPRLDMGTRKFFRALGPAVVGSGSVQLAMFADTILASFLPSGAVSALYYADRLYQLPVGVVAVAAGTVLLAEASRMMAAGDYAGAAVKQARVAGFTMLLGAPCFVAFLMVPDVIMAGLFARGAFGLDAALASADVLSAYAVGLPAVLLIRTASVSFHARGDTRTPLYVALAAVALNIVAKVLFIAHFSMGAAGLALATSIGAWVNLVGLAVLSQSRGFLVVDASLSIRSVQILVAGLLMAAALWLCLPHAAGFTSTLPSLQDEVLLVLMAMIGAVVYGLGLLLGKLLTHSAQRGQN